MTSRSSIIKVSVLADASSLRRELDRSGGTADRFQKKMGTVGKAAVGFLAFQAANAVKAFVDDSVRAFSDLEQATGGTEAVFGNASDVIDDFARGSAEAIGLSEAEFRTATTSIGGQLKRMTGDVDYAAEHSVALTEVAADLAATYGGTTAEAVGALGAAFRGEADPAERFNLNLKQSAVQAKAVEMGLADSTSEVDENARAQATLALITEQSADAQGQFSRESDTVAGQAQITQAHLENQKAVVGETLQVYKDWGNFLQLSMGRALADLALGIQEMTGEISKGEATLRRWETQGGQSITSFEQLADQIAHVTEEAENISFWGDLINESKEQASQLAETLPDMIQELNLTYEELIVLNKEQEIWADQMGLDEEAAASLAEVLDSELKQAQIEAMEESRRMASQHNKTRDATDEHTGSVEDNIAALQEQQDVLKAQLDPIFGVMRAHEDLEEAQKAVNDAIEEHGEGSDEHVDALMGQGDAVSELRTAYLELKEQGINPTRGELARLMEDYGFTREEADLLIDKLEDLEGVEIGDKTFRVTASAPVIGYTQSGESLQPYTSGYKSLQRGGIATDPMAAVVGDAGAADEAVIPLNSRGIGVLAEALREAIGGMAVSGGHRPPQPPREPTTVINLTVQALDPHAAARAVVEALQQYERANGAVPIRVRAS